jgi:hypothetical protein
MYAVRGVEGMLAELSVGSNLVGRGGSPTYLAHWSIISHLTYLDDVRKGVALAKFEIVVVVTV